MDVGKSKVGDMTGNVAALVLYLASFVLGFIPALVFLFVDTDNKFIKFHAIQCLALQVAAMILVITCVGWIVPLVFVVIAAIKSNNGELYKAPLVGNMAAKWAGIDDIPGQAV